MHGGDVYLEQWRTAIRQRLSALLLVYSPTLKTQLEPSSNQMKRKKARQSHIRSVRMVESLFSPRECDHFWHMQSSVCSSTSAMSATPPTMGKMGTIEALQMWRFA